MKQLEVEFQSNVDQCGLHTFKQIKRSGKAALYQRIRKDGTTHSYEAFKIKIVKAGTIFAKGAKPIDEDYESYPGKAAFGRYAYSCVSLDQAEECYEKILKGQIEDSTVEDGTIVKSKRGRKAKDRSTIKVPKDKFTIKQLEIMNPDFNFGTLYQHIRSLLNIEFKIVEMLRGKRGKPTIVYAPIELSIAK